MKSKKKQKLKKILSFIGCFALAFLLCALPFVKSTNSASAYNYQPNYKYNINLNDYPSYNSINYIYDINRLYSEFITITNNNETYDNVANTYIDIPIASGVSSITETFDIKFNFNSSYVSNYIDKYVLNSSSTLDTSSLISSYLDYYNLLSSTDKFYSVYLPFWVESSSNYLLSSANSTFIIKSYTDESFSYSINLGTNNTFSAPLYDNNGVIQPMTSYLLNLSYLTTLDFSNGSLSYLLQNYYFSFTIEMSNWSTRSYSFGSGLYFENFFNYYINRYMTFNDNFLNDRTSFTFINVFNNDLAIYYLTYSSNLTLDFDSYWQEYYSNFYSDSITNSYTNGYELGYNQGLLDGTETDEIVSKSILSFVSYPFTILSGFLNFNILGFNIYNILLGFITTLLLIWVIKKLN